jgi:hypothetical protein
MRFVLIFLVSLVFSANSFARGKERAQELKDRAQDYRQQAQERRVEDGRAHGQETAMERWKRHFERQEQKAQADGVVTEEEQKRLDRFRQIEDKRRERQEGKSRAAQ